MIKKLRNNEKNDSDPLHPLYLFHYMFLFLKQRIQSRIKSKIKRYIKMMESNVNIISPPNVLVLERS
jgi:hypothetical protein